MKPDQYRCACAALALAGLLLSTGCTGEAPDRPVSPGVPAAAAPQREFSRVRVTDALGAEVEAVCVYAAPQASTPAGGRPGTQGDPLPSLRAGLELVRKLRTEGQPVCLRLLPGIYREECPDVLSDLDATRSLVQIEGVEAGQAVICGSDRWTGWTLDPATGIYGKAWPHAWGFSGIDYSGRNAPLGQRREMVFVDGRRLVQVLQAADLAPGRFLVDEQAKRLLLKPPMGVASLDAALVEVAVRGEKALLRARNASNVIIRRLAFRHAASAQREAPLFVMRCASAIVEDITVLDCNWGGIKLDGAQAGHLRNCLIRGVGGTGLALGSTRNFRVEQVTAEDNCWRAHLGGLRGWDSAGVKCGSLDQVVFDGVESSGNINHGIWLDTNVTQVILRNCRVERNLGHGIYLEKNLGPIALERCTVGNNEGGVLIVNTSQVKLSGCRLLDNAEAQLLVSARSSYPKHKHWLTGEDIVLDLAGITLDGNTIYGRNEYRGLIQASGDKALVERFLTTLTATGNTYACSSADRAFDILGAKTGFDGWRKRTGQETTSTFRQTKAAEELDY